ncbi:MAG TPA: DUF2306 domain-containing protein [Vicinamibacterales bacterium]
MPARVAGWAAVVISVLILLAFSAIRFADMTSPSTALRAGGSRAADGFDIRYVQHPLLAVLHIVPGLVFLTLAPLQFVPRIRQRHLRVHRRLGWVLATCAATSGLLALIINVRFPAFGGISTQSATVFFGAIFLFSLTKAIRHIRKKEIQRHREWMLRTYALAMGVATIRVFVGLFMALSNYTFAEVFGAAFWLGFSVNLLAAEVWINASRAHQRAQSGDRTLRVDASRA